MISRSELQERIEDNQRKIADILAFSDDPKIAKIIRVLQKQIARDQYELTKCDHNLTNVSCPSFSVGSTKTGQALALQGDSSRIGEADED